MADDKTFTQADIDAAVKAANDKLQESIDKLEAKTEQLIGENRKLKRGADIKPEDLQAAEDRADKAEKAFADAQRDLKAANTAKEKAEKALETESGFTQKLLIQDGLKSALIANGVKDEDFIDSLTAKFASGATVKVDGETRTAVYGDKALGDFIKEWAGSDAGKKFVSAPANSGGGAPGGGKGETGKTMARSAFDALPPAEQHAFIKEGGKPVDQAA
jgi:hypothetical protein